MFAGPHLHTDLYLRWLKLLQGYCRYVALNLGLEVAKQPRAFDRKEWRDEGVDRVTEVIDGIDHLNAEWPFAVERERHFEKGEHPYRNLDGFLLRGDYTFKVWDWEMALYACFRCGPIKVVRVGNRTSIGLGERGYDRRPEILGQ